MKQWHKSSSLFQATRFAIRGIAVASGREQNLRIHLWIALIVLCTLLFLRAHPSDIAVVLLAIIVVIGLEMLNTCIEILADAFHPEYSEAIRDVKDIAAGAVLLSSVIALVIGLLVFSSTIERYFL